MCTGSHFGGLGRKLTVCVGFCGLFTDFMINSMTAAGRYLRGRRDTQLMVVARVSLLYLYGVKLAATGWVCAHFIFEIKMKNSRRISFAFINRNFFCL